MIVFLNNKCKIIETKHVLKTMKHIAKLVFFLIFIIVDYGFLNPGEPPQTYVPLTKNPFEHVNKEWVDSVYNSMTLEQRIGQLFMVAAYTTPDQSNKQQIAELITNYGIGGIIFMKGTPINQVLYTNYFQSLSKVPLLVAIDGEWGLAMRLDSTISFPRQLMLGAVTDNKLIYKMGYEIGRQCKRMGIHVNFAPVVDINNNPNNPVINSRSFGELKHNVAVKGDYYMTGMQDQGIITTAKHFPGHGDTDADSHKSLPIIPHTKARLDSVELYPFNYLIQRNLTGVMVAHLYIPEIDRTKNQASTLSPKIVQDMLRNQLGFNGLIFTDALNMQGVSKFYKPGLLEIKALLAGNDVLLFPENVPVAVAAIKEAIKTGKMSEKIIENRCKKILAAKSWAGITNSIAPISTAHLYEDLHTPQAELLVKKLVRASITVAKDDANQLPIQQLDKQKIAYVSLQNQDVDTFLLAAKQYTSITPFVIPHNTEYTATLTNLINDLRSFTTVIVNIVGSSQFPSKKYGITQGMIDIVSKIAKEHNVILVLHANPYALDYFKDAVPSISSIVIGYDFSKMVQYETPQVLFGALPAQGLLPVGVGGLPAGTGKLYRSIDRLRYATPFEAGMNEIKLQIIDSIVNAAIAAKATPGCQVLVAKNGIVVFNKAYGTYSYDSKQQVTPETLYDLASLTKVAATTISLMKLYDQKLFSLDATLGTYIPQARGTNKDTLRMSNILTHQASLHPWIPFYQYLIQDFFNPKVKDIKNNKRTPIYSVKINNNLYVNKNYGFIDSSISSVKSDLYSLQIADNVYMNPAKRDLVYSIIYNSKLNDKKEFVYSDLGFILFADVIKNLTGRNIDVYVKEEFYSKLGAQSLCYNPLQYYTKQSIAPTEYDEVFRRQLIQGYVHDPAAAMLGGVSGHAGLFGNANDLAKVLQMLLQKGYYGGEQFIQESTVDLFTSCPFCAEGNRRGYGFDRAESDTTKLDPTCRCTSELSYGHTGFTGTIFWVDPAQQLVYIFLSNRVCPDADNTLLANSRIRPKIQQTIYNAIIRNELN
jgi:beta-glucosidase-like glycosyl hydrolase/CubicO group peptidase (beta-lactamase class C family)